MKRSGTGWMDGRWGVVAGHVESGETVLQAALRELDEEIGVRAAAESLELVHVMHRDDNVERVGFFFRHELLSSDAVVNREPHKCAGLAWYELDMLPTDMVPYMNSAARLALGSSQANYSEFA